MGLVGDRSGGNEAAAHHDVVTWKSDESPVSDADHAADTAIRRHIRTAFPNDTVLSEESGEHAGDLLLALALATESSTPRPGG